MPKLSDLIANRSEEFFKAYGEFLESHAAKGDQTAEEIAAFEVERDTKFPPDYVDESVFGIEVDCDDIIVPHGLREAGLLAKTENGEFTDLVLDTAINMTLSHVEVMIEFTDDIEIGDAVNLVSTAASIKTSLSILPPKDASEATFEAWCVKIERITRAFLRQPNMAQFLLPVSSYIEYMLVETLAPDVAAAFVPKDEYIIRNFHSVLPIERSDAMKARVRAIVLDHFGGEEGFKEFSAELFSSILDTVDLNSKQIAEENGLAKPAAEGSTVPTE